MAAADEITVFVDTTLGTRLALSVPPECTAGDLKRKIKPQHHSCFPNVGEIKVQSLMVKKKSTFYHLPDSMPVKVFQSFHGTCFFRMAVSPFDATYNEERNKRMEMPKDITREIVQDPHGTIDMPQTTEFISDLDSAKVENIVYQPRNNESQRLGQNVKGFESQQISDKRNDQSSSPLKKIRSRSFSEEISVTSLISKYFSDGDEMNSSRIMHNRNMDAEETTPQYNNVINHDPVDYQASISKFSAKHESPNRLDLDFNTSVSREFMNETSTFSNARCSDTIPHGTTRDAETFSVGLDRFSQFKNKASRNKVIKSVNRKIPHSSSKLFSSNSHLDDRLGLSTIHAAKYEVGKRLSSAANRIWPPDNSNRSSMSMFVKRVNHSTRKSDTASLVKRFSFESSDSDG